VVHVLTPELERAGGSGTWVFNSGMTSLECHDGAKESGAVDGSLKDKLGIKVESIRKFELIMSFISE
jgi:hypothetical protein